MKFYDFFDAYRIELSFIVAVLIAILVIWLVLADYSDASDTCKAKGGVYKSFYKSSSLCFKPEALIPLNGGDNATD